MAHNFLTYFRGAHRKTKSRYSKLIVFLCFVTVTLFTQQCMFFYWNEKTVDPILIGFFFACFGFEFGSLAFIKCKEYRYMKGDKVVYVERIEEKDDQQAN